MCYDGAMKETFSGLESGVIGTIDMDQPVWHDQFYPPFCGFAQSRDSWAVRVNHRALGAIVSLFAWLP